MLRKLGYHFCVFMARWAMAESNMWGRMGFHRLSWYHFRVYNHWDFAARRFAR